MKIFLFLFLLSGSAFSQSTYSHANQDSESTSEKGNSQLQTGYINEDLENEEVEFSGEVGDGKSLPEEHRDLKGMETEETPGQIDN